MKAGWRVECGNLASFIESIDARFNLPTHHARLTSGLHPGKKLEQQSSKVCPNVDSDENTTISQID